MSERIIKEDLHLKNNNNDLFLIKEGELDLYYNDKWVDTLKEGDPFGIFSILTLLPDKDKIKSIRVVPLAKQNICYTLKSDVIQNVPVLQWRYLELYKNRLNRK
jgi:hypothetical protein